MILAGDIGGTHARLAFFDVVDGRFSLVSASIFPSREYSGLDEIVAKFVDTANLSPDTACFGIAGPVRNGRVEASNLPWIIESKRLADELKIKKAFLINDLEANAWGIPALDAKDVVALNHVKGQPVGNQAVIAAGTGLGQAGMYWDGVRHHVFACEGGHGDFAPRNPLEVELFNYLRTRFGHVSYERIVSGPGLVNVFSFLRDTGRGAPRSGFPTKWRTPTRRRQFPALAWTASARYASSRSTCSFPSTEPRPGTSLSRSWPPAEFTWAGASLQKCSPNSLGQGSCKLSRAKAGCKHSWNPCR